MKILTAQQMRAIDAKTIESGIPSLILMENAAHRVVEYLQETFPKLHQQRIVVFCGKGNNGGDGLAIARQLYTRIQPRSLNVVLAADPRELRGDAAENLIMLRAYPKCPVQFEITPEMHSATLIIDALLGTGLDGPAKGKSLEFIRAINDGFGLADVVAVDVPSGMASDSGVLPGDCVDAGHTVTFTAPKLCHVITPAADRCGKLRVAPIGTPAELLDKDPSLWLSLSEPALFAHLLLPRVSDSNKGSYGHALIVAGARGKTGAAAMAGLAALKMGAGLSTIASAESAIDAIASYAPEVMTEPLPETEAGSISNREVDGSMLAAIVEKKTVLACGPGLGSHPETIQFVRRLVDEILQPMVIDADALNALARKEFHGKAVRILTPHPGEMARLIKRSVADVQADRIGHARTFAAERNAWMVLKGSRTVIAAPDGRVWLNPTGSPALSTGGTGDVLTGLITGLLAQFPNQTEACVLAAVYLHGRAGELGAAQIGEQSFVATDIFRYLPEAIREAADLSN
jgi:ADP-dependent NAD(P)H-hydrate dehydratase / NAD(P)H-hydrate epimerase